MPRKLGFLVTVGLLAVLVATPMGIVPVQLSYVYSESMHPTIESGDGYVLLPGESADVNDIITYWSPERSAFVTHRVVSITTMGYVTQGDNNPTTDQAAGYPIVRPDQVVGRVLTVGDSPVIIPDMGRVNEFVQKHQKAIVVLIIAISAWQIHTTRSGGEGRRQHGSRRMVRVGQVVVPTLVIATVLLIALVYLGTTAIEVTYVSSEAGGTTATLMKVGEPKETTLLLNVIKTPFTHIAVETTGMETIRTKFVDPETATQARYTQAVSAVDTPTPTSLPLVGSLTDQLTQPSVMLVDVRVPALEAPGATVTTTRVYPYPATLPGGVLDRLHAIHPLIAATVSATLTFLPVYFLYRILYTGYEPIRLPFTLPGGRQ